MNTPTQNLTILHDTQEWSTEIEGEIGEIRVDGKRLNDVHDLATKIDKITTVIKALTLTATFLAIVLVAGVSAIGSWLFAHHDQINTSLGATQSEITKLNNSNLIMGHKLKSLGWVLDANTQDWQQIGNKDPRISK